MKKTLLGKVTAITAAASIVLAMVMVGPGVAMAQGGLTYNSGFQVQNLSTTMTASISINYYNQSDGSLLGFVADTILPNANKTYFPITLPGSATTFNGSVVISSDQPVASIVNLLGSGAGLNYGESYSGFGSGGTSFKLPLIMCNNGGFNTFFNVQNTSPDTTANIGITYTPGSAGTAQSELGTIAPGAAKTFDQASGSATKNCSTLADGSGKFVGSGIITSTQPIVATVVQLNVTTFATMLIYNGFSAGSTTAALPLIMANNSSFYTSINVQNAGASSTTITVTYSANTVVGGLNPLPESFTLAAGAGKAIIQNGAPPGNGSVNNWTTIGKYVGSATIANSGGQLLVAVGNEVGAPVGQGPFGSAYEGFDPAAATANASAPLIMANNSSFYTSLQIQNVGSSTCSGITVTYSPNTGGSTNPIPETGITLNAGLSKTIIQNGSSGNGSLNNWTTIGKYIGSATVVGAGCKLAVIVNEFRPGVGAYLFTYDAFNF